MSPAAWFAKNSLWRGIIHPGWEEIRPKLIVVKGHQLARAEVIGVFIDHLLPGIAKSARPFPPIGLL